MACVFRPTYTKRDPSTGARARRKSKVWWVQYSDANGVIRRQRGYRDKAASLQLARDLEKQSARRAVGMVDEYLDHSVRPIEEHVADFRRHLETKGGGPSRTPSSTSP